MLFKDLPSPPSFPPQPVGMPFMDPTSPPSSPPLLFPIFSCRRSQSFVRLTKKQNKNRRQILDHAAAEDELLDVSC